MIKKFKEIRELKRNLDKPVTFDGRSKEKRKEKIEELKDDILQNINFMGWGIVYLGLIPLTLQEFGMSEDHSLVLGQIIMFTTLLPYLFLRASNNLAWLIVFYVIGMALLLILSVN